MTIDDKLDQAIQAVFAARGRAAPGEARNVLRGLMQEAREPLEAELRAATVQAVFEAGAAWESRFKAFEEQAASDAEERSALKGEVTSLQSYAQEVRRKLSALDASVSTLEESPPPSRPPDEG